MLPGWLSILVFIAFAAALVALARHGERTAAGFQNPASRRAIYALSCCAVFSSGSFFGSIALASYRGIDFLAIYLGPAIVFACCHPLLARMIRIAKAQNITSVADFIAARYGKAGAVAATMTTIAALGAVPLLASQIKTVAQSLAIFIDGRVPAHSGVEGSTGIIVMLVAPLMAALTIAVGARRIDATEHRRGLIIAVAADAAVGLVAFVAVGIFVCAGLFDGINDLTEHVARSARLVAVVDTRPDLTVWLPLIATAMGAALVMPQQFHTTIIENRNQSDIKTAAWLVPVYIAVVSAFVLPIALAGRSIFPDGGIDRDFTVLALSMRAGNPFVSILALVGAFSAATAMVLVATTALSIMVCNDLVIPIVLRMERLRRLTMLPPPPVLAIRRATIVSILALATWCALAADKATLSTFDLWSLCIVVQIAPALLLGLIWTRGTARGAIGGSIGGLLVGAYTLGLPALWPRSSPLLTEGPLAIQALRPNDLFGLPFAPLGQGLVWSLAINVALYVALSLSRGTTANERLQANIFVRLRPNGRATGFRARQGGIAVDDLLEAVSRYLSPQSAERVFHEYHVSRGLPLERDREADAQLILYAEHLIASVIGTASSRTVIALVMEKSELSRDAAQRMVEDVAVEIQASRDILQHAIDIASDGMAIYDAELRLVAWNRAYRDMFQLPAVLMRAGTPLDVLIRSNAERGFYGEGVIEEIVALRLEALTGGYDGLRIYAAASGRVLEMRSVRLHNGGIFFTYTDATAQAQSEEELEAENETLEARVRERTEQLESLNLELIRAKAEADDANISKSRFLAAASHDILQPLSAARLYATSLRERLRARQAGDDAVVLASNVDASLEAVEDILGALLEISQLDAGATGTEITAFDINPILLQLKLEFQPIAIERGLGLTFMPSSLRVVSDRKLLRRLLQNLVSNAVKYTSKGRILVGARRRGGTVRIDVYDTGVGIPLEKQVVVFREFERLPAGAQMASGVGLGLSIVQRLSRVLEHEVSLRSVAEKGSVFSVTLPLAAPSTAVATAMNPAAPIRQGSLERLVVAAIDNEPAILTGMTVLLQGWGCIVAGGTGLRMIEMALTARDLMPDVIVADYHVGELDGLAIIAALRRRFGPCPAVLITADRDLKVRDLAQAADVRVLYKPLKPAALRSLLSQWRLMKAAAE